ncbi:hypothetical protein KVR01_012433 [Diaporthe batatas]|uniref:uncharacterized protein n=1 Tax=Diaporthe batatas TaxID=748121 RepID=UPI001D0470EA|nr:uncharacterized protein KVR01_012433 [Diaporthe batatas]KAG8157771.1 hypothetical protein KVR01_012433 [Diaporthe batatas]
MTARAQSVAASTDWLPSQGAPTLPTKNLHPQYIRDNKQSDWFICLAWAIDEYKNDQVQSRMLCKLYAFMLDYIPTGLAGDFAHIRGGDVMDQLLSHNEKTASRHRVTKQAEIVFAELETWMKGHKSWEEALQHPRESRKSNASRRREHKPQAKATQLLSPAGMMAVLVIAYPNHKRYKDYIHKLDISWMMTQPRENLEVRGGFWKGITIENLYTVFRPAEAREAEQSHLADYNQLFGQDFMRCRQDLKPYLQPWARGLSLEEPAPDGDSDGSDAADGQQGTGDQPGGRLGEGTDSESSEDDSDLSSAESTSTAAQKDVIVHVAASRHNTRDLAEVYAVRSHVDALSGAELTELVRWLLEKLDSETPEGPTHILKTWCTYWEGRVERPQDDPGQDIVRELFMQSLQRLRSLGATISDVAAAYMLVDMEGGIPGSSPPDSRAALRNVQSLPGWRALEGANKEFIRLAQLSSENAASFIKQTTEVQKRVLSSLAHESPYKSHLDTAVEFETSRTNAIIRNLRDLPDKVLRGLPDTTSAILRNGTVRHLRLTNWQLRGLLLPGANFQDLLTPSQRTAFEQALNRPSPFELGSLKPMSSYPLTPTNYLPEISEKHPGLSNLFRRSVLASPVQLPAGHATDARTSTAPLLPVPRRSNAPERPKPPAADSEGAPAIHKPNAFSGSVYVPGKRRLASNGKDSKKPRLDLGELIDDRNQLKEQVLTGFGDLKDMVSTATNFLSESASQTSMISSMCGDINARVGSVESMLKSSSEGFNAELGQLRSCTDSLKMEFEGLKRELRTDMESLRHESERRDDQTRSVLDAIKAGLEACAREVKSVGRTTKRVRKELPSQAQSILDAFNNPANNPPAQVGEDGFLGVQCPAPDGWSQKEYEKQLERAAWSYICFLGSPDEGVCPDEDALATVQDQFPHLAEDHIVSALDHIHMRIYHHPLGRVVRQDNDNFSGQ